MGIYGLDSQRAFLISEEDEDLKHRVVPVVREKVELTAAVGSTSVLLPAMRLYSWKCVAGTFPRVETTSGLSVFCEHAVGNTTLPRRVAQHGRNA